MLHLYLFSKIEIYFEKPFGWTVFNNPNYSPFNLLQFYQSVPPVHFLCFAQLLHLLKYFDTAPLNDFPVGKICNCKGDRLAVLVTTTNFDSVKQTNA